MPPHLSLPRRAKWLEMSIWSWDSTFKANRPLARILGKDVEVCITKSAREQLLVLQDAIAWCRAGTISRAGGM
jgi:hypothetical protein